MYQEGGGQWLSVVPMDGGERTGRVKVHLSVADFCECWSVGATAAERQAACGGGMILETVETLDHLNREYCLELGSSFDFPTEWFAPKWANFPNHLGEISGRQLLDRLPVKKTDAELLRVREEYDYIVKELEEKNDTGRKLLDEEYFYIKVQEVGDIDKEVGDIDERCFDSYFVAVQETDTVAKLKVKIERHVDARPLLAFLLQNLVHARGNEARDLREYAEDPPRREVSKIVTLPRTLHEKHAKA